MSKKKTVEPPKSEFDEQLEDLEGVTPSPELRKLIQIVRKIANKVDCPPEE